MPDEKFSKDISKYKDNGLERTPRVTPVHTPRVTPVDVGHLSGGEVNQLGIGGPSERQPKK